MREAWTEERVEFLKKCWADGLSASQVAAKMGLTRNAVIGKVCRLGLAGRKLAQTPRVRSSPPRSGAGVVGAISLHRRKRPSNPSGAIPPDTSVLERLAAETPPPEFLGIPFLDLEPNHCRYPRGEGRDTLFCGQPKMLESSYCAHCHRLCHEVARRVVSEEEHLRRSASAKRVHAMRRAQAEPDNATGEAA